MPVKILVVDDDPQVRKLCTIALKSDGYEVSGANDAQRALNIVDTKSIDLMLLDIVMPGTDGLELLQILKKKWEELIVIMITGFPSIETSIKAIMVLFSFSACDFNLACKSSGMCTVFISFIPSENPFSLCHSK